LPPEKIKEILFNMNFFGEKSAENFMPWNDNIPSIILNPINGVKNVNDYVNTLLSHSSTGIGDEYSWFAVILGIGVIILGSYFSYQAYNILKQSFTAPTFFNKKFDAPKQELKVDAPKQELKVDAPKQELKVDAPKQELKVDAYVFESDESINFSQEENVKGNIGLGFEYIKALNPFLIWKSFLGFGLFTTGVKNYLKKKKEFKKEELAKEELAKEINQGDDDVLI
jgi:hypothetical protein